MDILFLGICLTGRHKEAIIKMYLVKIEKGKSEWPFQFFILFLFFKFVLLFLIDLIIFAIVEQCSHN